MNVIIVDSSKGEFRKISQKEISTYLVKINSKVYIGEIPMRSIESLIKRFKKIATRSTNCLFLIRAEDGYHGWKGVHIGSYQKEYEKFLGFSFNVDFD